MNEKNEKHLIKSIQYSEPFINEQSQVVVYCKLFLINDFEVVGSSTCFDHLEYDVELGKFYAYEDALKYLRVIFDYKKYEEKTMGKELRK